MWEERNRCKFENTIFQKEKTIEHSLISDQSRFISIRLLFEISRSSHNSALLYPHYPCQSHRSLSTFEDSLFRGRSVGNGRNRCLSILSSSARLILFLSALQDCDNLADGSERDSPWSCGGGSGTGRRPLTSIIEQLHTSKSKLHNGEWHNNLIIKNTLFFFLIIPFQYMIILYKIIYWNDTSN